MNPYVEQFRKISHEVLRKHIGVAAEFVVDDALKASRLDAETSVMIALPIFLEHLANGLPQRLPIPTIIMEVRHRLSN
ncbi:MAG: hypothetical protein RLY82_684 [Pseudomonadota bacterium]|jgi:hypothetical protein